MNIANDYSYTYKLEDAHDAALKANQVLLAYQEQESKNGDLADTRDNLILTENRIPNFHSMLAFNYYQIGVCLLRLGKQKDASNVLFKGYEEAVDHLGEDHEHTLKIKARLDSIKRYGNPFLDPENQSEYNKKAQRGLDALSEMVEMLAEDKAFPLLKKQSQRQLNLNKLLPKLKSSDNPLSSKLKDKQSLISSRIMKDNSKDQKTDRVSRFQSNFRGQECSDQFSISRSDT